MASDSVDVLPVVYHDDGFVATPCRDCDVPGYLILRARAPVRSFAALGPSALARLGPVLALLEDAIVRVTLAERVYVLRLSEGLADVHFHLFPRTAEHVSRWRDADGHGLGDVNGELLFAWARQQYRVSGPEALAPQTLATASRVRAIVARNE